MSSPFNPRLIVLAGPTGSGKTAVLQHLSNYHFPVIDLEAIASHRGSVFGRLGTLPEQPSQTAFEQLLQEACRQYLDAPFIFTEQEAAAVGKRRIPGWFYERMQEGWFIHLHLPKEERIGHILADYGHLPPQKLLPCINLLSDRLSAAVLEELKQLVLQQDYYTFVDRILDYYDRASGYNAAKEQPGLHLHFRRFEVAHIAQTIIAKTRIIS